MIGVTFRAWHKPEKKMYYRAYQKLFFVLLCDDDHGANGGKGTPVRRAGFDDCDLLQGTTVIDTHGAEVFEGDIVRITCGDKEIVGEVGSVPDMYKSRRLHPLHDLLAQAGIADKAEGIQVEILGNVYTNPDKGNSR